MCRPKRVEGTPPGAAELAAIGGRVQVFDDLLSPTQLLLLAEWALRTPHWMLTNSVYDGLGRPQHRIWGASYIRDWQRGGWPGLPPVLFAALATLFARLRIVFTAPRYIGLNGQSRGQDASLHVDCASEAADELSMLVYIGEDTSGDLLIFDRDCSGPTHSVRYRPNRVVAFDGSLPHRALAPADERFRMSIVVRGRYAVQAGGAPAPDGA